MDLDFSKVERVAPYRLGKLVLNSAVDAHFVDDNRFWYVRDVWCNEETAAAGEGANSLPLRGKVFVLVDTATGEQKPAFDHDRLAQALSARLRNRKPPRGSSDSSDAENSEPDTSAAAPTAITAETLPFDEFEFVDHGHAIAFVVDGTRWQCSLETCTLRRDTNRVAARPYELVSPDGRLAAFVRGNNLWVRSLVEGWERQLTQDGRRDYGYATRPDFYGRKTVDELAGRRGKPAALWSPDSTRLLTHHLDQRKVRRLPVMQYVPDGPRDPAPAKMHTVHYPLPGDEELPTVTHHILGIDGSRVDVAMDRIEIYNTDAPISPFWENAWWGKEGKSVYLIRPTRGCKSLQFWSIDGRTGEARQVLEETGDQFYDLDMRADNQVQPDVRVIESVGRFVWTSQKDGWYHLSLRDLQTGELRQKLTSGDWVVRELLGVDAAGEWVYFLGSGREADRDAYLRHLYRVRLDGSDLQLLTPEDADHAVTLSPDLTCFVDTYSRIDLPPVSVLRKVDGTLVAVLEEADVGRLLAAGYQVPQPFTVKAADGETDLHGVLIAPPGLTPGQKVPLVEYEYGGPQTSLAPKRFTVGREWDACVYAQMLVQLGFAAMIVDGRGTPGRSKAFHHAKSRLGDAAGLADHVAAIDQLATQYDFIDRDRVGIYGFSGGGYGSARALMTWPEVYKVAVSCCGDHDNRLYDATWWDRYMGDWSAADAVNEAPAQDNQALAANLEGHLLLMHGDVDDNVHPALTMRLVDALIGADKDFDMLLLPNRGHALARDRYVMKRTLDYFRKHL